MCYHVDRLAVQVTQMFVVRAEPGHGCPAINFLAHPMADDRCKLGVEMTIRRTPMDESPFRTHTAIESKYKRIQSIGTNDFVLTNCRISQLDPRV